MKPLNRFAIPIIAIILLFTSANIRWGGDNWRYLITFDGKGYYSYLPAIFIYHDMQFGFYDKIENKYYKRQPSTYKVNLKNGIIDKYYSGVALAISPFFLLAHTIALTAGGDADGYSQVYAIFTGIAAIFYTLLGLYFIRKLLRTYAVPEWANTLLLFAIVFGTNVFHYVVAEPAMSHIYSMAFMAIFVYYCRAYFLSPGRGTLIFAALALGMIVLIRPVNILALAGLPFLSGGIVYFRRAYLEFIRDKKGIIIALAAFMAVAGIQSVLYYMQARQLLADSYPVEHFNWLYPRMAKILFGYRKGFFIYTPLFFLALSGLIPVWKESRFAALGFVIFFGLVTYVLSCWWCWYYGASFGLRAYIEYYPFFTILLARGFETFKTRFWVRSYSVLILILMLVCQFQTYQYRYGFINISEMNKERYWNVFMRIDLVLKHQNPNGDLLK